MKEIKLTQGKFTLVDDKDFNWLNQWNWYALKQYNTFYAYRNLIIDGRKTICGMHRLILRAPVNIEIDHINGDGLDNRRSNLKKCTTAQNQWNRHAREGQTQFKGITFLAKRDKWQAQIRFNRKKIYLDYFLTKEESARAYDNAAQKYFGEFANINFK